MDDGAEPADHFHGGSSKRTQGASSQIEALVTVPLDLSIHRVSAFVCRRSERIQGFFQKEYARLAERNYCRVFVLQNPDDATRIWGYYTLSAGLVEKSEISTQHQKRVLPGLPIPMIRIGFLGRDDSTNKDQKLGGVLLHDAALRVYRCEDITGWGLYLDAENEDLAKHYERVIGFKRTKSKPLVLYAPLKAFLPDIK